MIQLSKKDQSIIDAFVAKYEPVKSINAARVATAEVEKPDAKGVLLILKPILKMLLPLLKFVVSTKTYSAIKIALGLMDGLIVEDDA